MSDKDNVDEVPDTAPNDHTDPLLFCLICNSSLENLRQREQSLVLVSNSSELTSSSTVERNEATTNQQLEKGGVAISAEEATMSIINANDGQVSGGQSYKDQGDDEWINKYQTFLSKTLHINFDEFLDDDIEPSTKRFKTEGEGETALKYSKVLQIEVALFCSRCKSEVERLYEINEQLNNTKKVFEETRDNIASTMIRTFVEQKIQAELESEEGEHEEVLNNATDALLEKWKHIYTGEADMELKERSLIHELKEEVAARSENRSKTEFPEGTGLSAMELAKMQRMMTACYFTPKMSIVRKKGKLFFRVGIPRQNDGKTYRCSICGEVFLHQRTLNIHTRKHRLHNRQRIHTCLSCGEMFRDRCELVFHKKTHHLGIPDAGRVKYKRFQEFYLCEFCGCKFSSKAGRSAHIKKAHLTSDKLFPCASCQLIFASESLLKDHVATAHRITSITIVNSNGDDSDFAEVHGCTNCPKAFLRLQSLIDHMKIHNDPNINGCYYCGFGFSSLELLAEHTAVIHEDPNPFTCEGCDERFDTETLVLAHIKSHRYTTFICETCGKVSLLKDDFKKHLLTHCNSSNLLPFACGICEVTFVDQKTLDAHMFKHTGKHPFKCDVCGDDEGFKDPKDLRKHMVEAHPDSILEDLPHTCKLCWIGFATEESLHEHTAKTHERYKCHICNRIFKLGDHLRRHQFIHTGEKPFKCSICDKSFNQESNLKEHLYRHSGVRPHRCPKCPGVAYLRRVQLKEHMQKEHGVEDVPTLPMGRAAQNARKAGNYPVPLNPAEQHQALPSAEDLLSDLKTNEIKNISSLMTQFSVQPVVVNDVTISDDGVHERIAPLIMKSLQNKSNQPIIVRRGIQVPEKPKTSNFATAIQIKPEEIVSEVGETEIDPSQQQYVIYL